MHVLCDFETGTLVFFMAKSGAAMAALADPMATAMIKAKTYGALLSPVLLTKLPSDLHLIVSRKASDSDLKMDALLKMFELELTARERVPLSIPDLQRRAKTGGCSYCLYLVL